MYVCSIHTQKLQDRFQRKFLRLFLKNLNYIKKIYRMIYPICDKRLSDEISLQSEIH